MTIPATTTPRTGRALDVALGVVALASLIIAYQGSGIDPLPTTFTNAAIAGCVVAYFAILAIRLRTRPTPTDTDGTVSPMNQAPSTSPADMGDPPARETLNVHGLCDDTARHDGPHTGVAGGMWIDCPGQHADCRNCDDRLCMSCVLRYHHDECVDDCPSCCHPLLPTFDPVTG